MLKIWIILFKEKSIQQDLKRSKSENKKAKKILIVLFGFYVNRKRKEKCSNT